MELSNSSSLWRPGEEHYGLCIQPVLIPAGAETLAVFPSSKGNNEFLWRMH
jgi:hypothetical protein